MVNVTQNGPNQGKEQLYQAHVEIFHGGGYETQKAPNEQTCP